jgi:hypothetical protein
MKPAQPVSITSSLVVPVGLFVRTQRRARMFMVASASLCLGVAVASTAALVFAQDYLAAIDKVHDAGLAVARAEERLLDVEAERRVLIDSLTCKTEGGRFYWSGDPKKPRSVKVGCDFVPPQQRLLDVALGAVQ